MTLSGRTIAIPESRELDVFAAMLERRGAAVIRCPLVAIVDAPDPGPILEWVRRFNAGEVDDLILLTGEGLRRIVSCIERHAPALRAEFIARLGDVRKFTRGPKPAKALRDLGLKPDIAAEQPTTEGVVAALSREDLRGRRVTVQRYGVDPNERIESYLESAGAHVSTVAPYIYADAAADAAVLDLLNKMSAGEVDIIAFTSSVQVDRLFSVGPLDLVKRALERTAVAAVGPVVASTLEKHDVKVRFMPEESFFMKPLTSAIEQAMSSRE